METAVKVPTNYKMLTESTSFISESSARAFALRFFRLPLSQASLQQAGVVLFDQGLSSLASFLTGVIVARASSKAQYGTFVLCLTILRFIAGIQNSVAGYPFTVNYPRLQLARRPAYLANTIVSQMWMLAGVGAIFLVPAIVSRCIFTEPVTIRVIDVLVFASVAFVARDCLRVMLLGQLSTWPNLLLGVAVAVFTLSGLCVVSINCILTIPTALAIIGLGAGIPTFVLGYLFLWTHSCFKEGEAWRDFLWNWNQGKWYTLRTFMYMGAFSVFPFFLGIFSDAQQVAAFGVCFSVSSLANPVVMGLASYLRPKLSQVAVRGDRSLWVAVVQIEAGSVILACLLIATTVLFGDKLILVLYGPIYSGLKWPLVWTAAGIAISILELPLMSAVEARRDTKTTFVARFCSSIFTLGPGLLLVKVCGLNGAIVGLFCSRLVGFVYLLFAFRTYHDESPAIDQGEV